MVSTNMFNDFLKEGASTEDVKLVPLVGDDHTSGIIPAGIASFSWFLEVREELAKPTP